MRSMYGAWRMKREAIYTPFFFFTQAFFGEDLERGEERTGRKKEERRKKEKNSQAILWIRNGIWAVGCCIHIHTHA